jgi:3-hydroxyacyl-CoA dehydrogenase
VLRQGGAQVISGGPGAAGIVAHLRLSLISACGRTLLAGASRDQLDRSFAAAGFARSPLRLIDAIGAKALNGARAAAGLAPDLLLVAMQDADLKLYASDGSAPDWLDTLRTEAGVVPRHLSAADILARVIAEMANTGAWLLQHAQAHRASDIDLAAICALGLPESLGGVMFAADQAGLITTRKRLRQLQNEGASAPVTLWDVLIRNGKHFADLDGH